MSAHNAEAMASEESLQTWITKATDPENQSERWDCIEHFYQQVNTQPDGPQVATRLLAHKIQSPQEREALQALTLLEACMNNCGKQFHSEAAKFRFLNELIKILSPKYLGAWSSAKVKQRVIEILYSWTLWLKEEPKVQEAYHMLKKQGIVKNDPKLPDTVMPPPSPRQDSSVFDDEDKAKLLSRLLKSGRPEDLQTANRLIKSTVKEEQEKMEKESRRIGTLEEVENCTSRLKLLLNQDHTHHMQEMKELYERCDKLRPNLFRLASDTVDNDEALAEILQGNDKLTYVMSLYREKTPKQETETETPPLPNHSQEPLSPVRTYHLIDFSAVGDSAPCGSVEESSSVLLLEENTASSGGDLVNRGKSYLDELKQLEDEEKVRREAAEMQRTCSNGDYNIHNAPWSLPLKVHQSHSTHVRHVQNQQTTLPFSKLQPSSSSLADITVSQDSIKPSYLKPIMIFDSHGVRVSLHFTKEAPSSHPDLAVFIISVVNSSSLPVSDFLLLAAAPKTMLVKLQPASRNELPPYSPILPPAAISQILLLSNPLRKPLRLRLRLTLTLGDQQLQHETEIQQFPEWNSWTQQ